MGNIMAICDYIVNNTEVDWRLAICGVLVDSVRAETGESLEKIYGRLLSLGTQIEDEMGVYGEEKTF